MTALIAIFSLIPMLYATGPGRRFNGRSRSLWSEGW